MARQRLGLVPGGRRLYRENPNPPKSPIVKGDFTTPLWKRGQGGFFIRRVKHLCSIDA